MNSKFFKGLLAAIIGALATIYGVEGATAPYYGVVVFGAVLIYFAQNAVFKPVSVFGTIDLWKDVIKGLIMALGTAGSAYGASLLLPDVTFTWDSFFDVLKVAFGAYLTKNILSNSKGELGPEK